MGKSKKLMGAAALALSTAFVGGTFAIGSVAAAQDLSSGALTGKVTDGSGSPVAGATVEIRSNDRGFTRTVRTSSSGSYRVAQLPTGSYTATVSADGYSSVTNEGIRITLSATAAFNAQLASSVGGIGENIVVVGQAQSISAF
ncbi:MAG: carboxypeptidase-like regulatory domain-containing protein, partial [Pseudomonadota bacterium]